MPDTVFFSWQNDRICNRDFIERALRRAIDRLNSSLELEQSNREQLAFDRDTQGEPGHPPVVDTIFKKIDGATAFVPDFTFVGSRADGRSTPNPNVLIEYGWALKSLSHKRIIAVMNAAFGAPTQDSLPFDMKHFLFPITFDLSDDASDESYRGEQEKLTNAFEAALRAILGDSELAKRSEKVKPDFSRVQPQAGLSRFRVPGIPLGISDNGSIADAPRDIFLADGPAWWLRAMPTMAQDRTWSSMELKRVGTGSPFLLGTLLPSYSDLGFVRGGDGFGVYAATRSGPTPAVTFAFETGEVWAVDSYLISAQKERAGTSRVGLPWPDLEKYFKRALGQYRQFLSNLGVRQPFKWQAGIEGIRGVGLFFGSSSVPTGTCSVDYIVEEGQVSSEQECSGALNPFFKRVFDRFGLERPDHLNNSGNRKWPY